MPRCLLRNILAIIGKASKLPSWQVRSSAWRLEVALRRHLVVPQPMLYLRAHITPIFGYPILGLGSCKREVGYPEKWVRRVRYKPTGNWAENSVSASVDRRSNTAGSSTTYNTYNHIVSVESERTTDRSGIEFSVAANASKLSPTGPLSIDDNAWTLLFKAKLGALFPVLILFMLTFCCRKAFVAFPGVGSRQHLQV